MCREECSTVILSFLQSVIQLFSGRIYKSSIECDIISCEEVYSRYYPEGAVSFFLFHHNENNIVEDIKQQRVYILETSCGYVGTVTIKGNGICRLFVLPGFQKKGYGRALLDFAEGEILAGEDSVCIDASYPAKGIYLKRGYRETEFHSIETENGDFLCYDVMEKKQRQEEKIC